MSSSATARLLDTNSMIEAVRVGAWNALCGGLDIQTVEECAPECRRGDTLSSGYISVSAADLGRLNALHSVSEGERAALLLRTEASSLDRGALDLYAHALGRQDTDADTDWSICSPDHASVKVGVALGWQDRLVSLEELMSLVGASPRPPLRRHFSRAWLSQQRTKALLGP